MKIVLTGGAGNITKPLAGKLLKEGHTVTVIGRNAENLKTLQGIIPAIGNIEDETFLVKAFEGADVVYTMTPMPVHVPDWPTYGETLGNKYAKAIKVNGVKKVVNLSTFGAHRREGIGPANLLGQVEKALDTLEDTEIIHLRAGYFYSNLTNFIPAIKERSVIESNYGDISNLLLLVHTDDIADVAANAITTPLFNDGQPFYVVGDVRSYSDVALVLGNAVDKRIQWKPFTDQQLKDSLIQNGLPEYVVNIFIEIGQNMANGSLNEHYFSLKPKPALSKIKLEDYAGEFKKHYEG